ncbi:MAG: GDP-L-fucose synthase [Nitrospirae bacterium]|nr:GDP-L-fucose synthase [Nitrospirota bacterium]
MEKASKIYIAGHRGMVGSSLMKALRSSGYNNIITRPHSELDLTRQKEVEDFFERERPDHVFLAAAKVGGILANNTYKAEFIYENIIIAANVIHSSSKYGVKKLLNLGSSCIYPKFAEQPIREESLLTGSLEPTNEPYAIAKISALKLCRYYNEQYGTNFISAMPTNLYGPFDNYNLETAHVLPALLRKFHLAKLLSGNKYQEIRRDIGSYHLGFGLDAELNQRSDNSIFEFLKSVGISESRVLIWGAGEVYREFLHVDDLADACLFLMLNYTCNDIGECVNIGTGEDIRVKDLALLIKDLTGFDGEIEHDVSKPDGTPKKLLDVRRMADLGWKANIKLDKGIRLTYDWYRRNSQYPGAMKVE